MRTFCTSTLDVRTFDQYAIYGQGAWNPPDDPIALTGFGPGLRRPQFCPAAGMLFFLDNVGHLWKFDGQYYWEIGVEADSDWESWRPEEDLTGSGYERIGPVGKSLIEGYATLVESGGLPVKPTYNAVEERYEVDVENFAQGAGDWTEIPQYPHTVVWINGFPFAVYETVNNAGVYTLYMVLLTDDMYFYHDWDAFSDGWDEIGAAAVPTRVVFAWDYSDDYEYGLFANVNQREDEVYQDGNLTGTYHYVFTLVSRDGHESNPCLEISTVVEDNIVQVDLGRVRVILHGATYEDWPDYDDAYIRNIKVYRTYADKPGVYYYHSTIPWGRVAWWESVSGMSTYLYWYFFDNTPDEQLGEQLHELKLVPRQGTAICSTKNTLIVADGTGVYVSEVGDPETFYTYLSYEGAVIGVAAIPFFDEFLVFLQNRIYAVNIFDYSQRLVCHGIGLAGRDAVCVMNDRILFQAHGGQICQYTGSGVGLVPGYERIANLMDNRTRKRQVNVSQYSATMMAYSQRRNQAWVLLGEDGRHGNLVLVIQPNQAFLLYKFHPSVQVTCYHMFQQGGQEAVLLGLSDGTIVSMNPGAHSDDGLPIPVLIESGEIGLIDEQVRIRRLYTEVIASAKIRITLSGRYDSRGAYVSEGVVEHEPCLDGDERHVNTYGNKVVKAYQFKMVEESINGFTLKAFSLIYQPKTERVRNWR
jgi:hypothetical protein